MRPSATSKFSSAKSKRPGNATRSSTPRKVAGSRSIRSALQNASKANPFDVRGNAQTKYQVLGRRVKGQGRNVAAARAEAEKKRKKTLAVQFQTRNKSNEFRDRRLGEQDPSLSLEDKMMARFQSERKHKLRNAQTFALQDSDQEDDREDDNDDGDALFLTHQGSKIDDFDKLNAEMPLDFDDDHEARDDATNKMDREIVDQLHFGGSNSGAKGKSTETDKDPNHRKSHKEIMQEVMMKAKLFKAERQRSKAAQEDATKELDADFASLKGLLSFRPAKHSAEARQLERKAKEDEKKGGGMDEFDRLTRELTFEAKVLATERRLTPEELAKREHDRLEELEKQRVARMRGEEVSEDEDDEDGDGKKKRRKSKKKKKESQPIVFAPTDDDLADQYAVDGQFGEEGEEDEEDGAEQSEEEEEEEEGDSESDSDEDEDEDEDEDNEHENAETPEAGDDEHDNGEEEDASVDDQAAKPATEPSPLPFVFSCPTTLDELTALFTEHAPDSAEDRALIVERILTYYSPKLSAGNRGKMQTFFAILLQQFLHDARQYGSHRADLDSWSKHLCTLANELQDTVGNIARALIQQVYTRVHQASKTKTKTKAVSAWPSLAELLLFRAFLHIFPTTDLRHNVISPLETLLGEALMRGALTTRNDFVRALTTCTLVLHLTRERRCVTPEVVVCLERIFTAATDTSPTSPCAWLAQELGEWLATSTATELPRLDLGATASAPAPAIVHAALQVLRLVATQYQRLASFDELVYALYVRLHALLEMAESSSSSSSSSSPLHAVISLVRDHVQRSMLACWNAREPLRWQAPRPTMLPSLAPKFDENYTVRKDKTRSREDAQVKQLQRQVKRARKGAARELRRDAEFLAREKRDEEQARVAAHREKQKEIWSWLEEQQATLNQQVRKGGHMLKGGGAAPGKKRRLPKA